MATTADFIEYVCEQISGIGEIRYKKMFGEYMVYVNDKPIFIVCNNTVYVKQNEVIKELMKTAETGFPYKGAKEHYILEIDNSEFAKIITSRLESVTEVPKKKKK
ncbi:MAG: transcriptional regulator [Clostridia bacterium]|jgi:TfoX/Sxy family transcriptional regulator of competence genes|nr:transcriptional regulator [Clostridia bacterium]